MFELYHLLFRSTITYNVDGGTGSLQKWSIRCLSSNNGNGNETFLENKHLGNGDYNVIIASSHPLSLTEYAANWLEEAPLKWIQRMKNLLLCVHVVIKTLNLGISRCHLQDYVKESLERACREYSTIIFSRNQSDHCFLVSSLPLPIDPFHKWLPIINSFIIIKISLTNLVFELIIQKNFYSQTSLVRLI